MNPKFLIPSILSSLAVSLSFRIFVNETSVARVFFSRHSLTFMAGSLAMWVKDQDGPEIAFFFMEVSGMSTLSLHARNLPANQPRLSPTLTDKLCEMGKTNFVMYNINSYDEFVACARRNEAKEWWLVGHYMRDLFEGKEQGFRVNDRGKMIDAEIVRRVATINHHVKAVNLLSSHTKSMADEIYAIRERYGISKDESPRIVSWDTSMTSRSIHELCLAALGES